MARPYCVFLSCCNFQKIANPNAKYFRLYINGQEKNQYGRLHTLKLLLLVILVQTCRISMTYKIPLGKIWTHFTCKMNFSLAWFLADHTIGCAFGTLCRLSVCLSVCRLSVTFCIVAKRYVLAKNCLKEWIGNQGQTQFSISSSTPVLDCYICTVGNTAGSPTNK